MERSLNHLLEVNPIVKNNCLKSSLLGYEHFKHKISSIFLGETKRRSISLAFGAMFKRNSGQKEAILESTSNGYRYNFNAYDIFCTFPSEHVNFTDFDLYSNESEEANGVV